MVVFDRNGGLELSHDGTERKGYPFDIVWERITMV
jgi:hypothetical protein